MSLFQRRRDRVRRAAAAVGGAPTALTEKIAREARVKIVYAIRDHIPAMVSTDYDLRQIASGDIEDAMTWMLVREWGRASIDPPPLSTYLVATTKDLEILDAIECWYLCMARMLAGADANSRAYYGPAGRAGQLMEDLGAQFRDQINEIFDDFGIAWQLVGIEIVPRSSTAMHATIIEPVFALTTGSAEFKAVETSYQAALRELKPGGDPSDAITDAGRALQEMFEAVGVKGNALGQLLADARKKGLLAPYDSKLTDGIEAIGSWVSADRSERGDAHHVRDASRDDAWLAVRVAGALILRLGAGKKR